MGRRAYDEDEAKGLLATERWASMNTLSFAPMLLLVLRRQAEAAYPEEACGILIGREIVEPAGTWRTVERLLAAENVHEAGERYHRFTVDPRAFLRGERESAGGGANGAGVLSLASGSCGAAERDGSGAGVGGVQLRDRWRGEGAGGGGDELAAGRGWGRGGRGGGGVPRGGGD